MPNKFHGKDHLFLKIISTQQNNKKNKDVRNLISQVTI